MFCERPSTRIGSVDHDRFMSMLEADIFAH